MLHSSSLLSTKTILNGEEHNKAKMMLNIMQRLVNSTKPTLFLVLNENMNTIGRASETQLMDGIAQHGADIEMRTLAMHNTIKRN